MMMSSRWRHRVGLLKLRELATQTCRALVVPAVRKYSTVDYTSMYMYTVRVADDIATVACRRVRPRLAWNRSLQSRTLTRSQ